MSSPRPFRPLLAALAVVIAGALAAPADADAAKRTRSSAKASKKKKEEPPAVDVPVAEADAEQIKAAELVYYGKYECEFKQSLDIVHSPKHAAYAEVKSGKAVWLMKPVLSSTGAVRLEDVKGETLMVQIASKSMLLNVKSAQRVVDDCVGEKQREMILASKASPALGAALLMAPTAATTPAAATAASDTASSAPGADAATASASMPTSASTAAAASAAR